MKHFIKILFIIALIVSTAFVKSSTKDLEDKIYYLQENIAVLKEEIQMLRLEHDYLTSPQKLLEYKYMYFDEDLNQLKIENINTIYLNNNNFSISEFSFLKNEK